MRDVETAATFVDGFITAIRNFRPENFTADTTSNDTDAQQLADFALRQYTTLVGAVATALNDAGGTGSNLSALNANTRRAAGGAGTNGTGGTTVNLEGMKDRIEQFKDIVKENKGEIGVLDEIISNITNKKSNEIDTLLVRQLKGNIRRHESLAATRYEGVPDKHVHFLNLPFYETGGVKKNPIGEADINIIMNLIEEVKPHQIYAAGDLADPHGTHKVCLDAIFAALKNLKHKDYMKDCWVWLYRGAWHEWDIHEIEMAVPMSPAQVLKKRQAIFFHQSQKDGAMFQGDDLREFWQRAEARNSQTAQRYRNLGLADYEAIEAFKRYFF